MNLRGNEQDLGRVGVKSANMKIMQILYLYMKFSKIKKVDKQRAYLFIKNKASYSNNIVLFC